MAVTFNADSFTITVKTGTNPIESWLNTHNEMVDLLQSEDEGVHSLRYNYLELLRSMMPDWQTAKRMTE